MNSVVLRLASGNIFFYGIVIFVFISMVDMGFKGKGRAIFVRAWTIIGVISVLLSATPLPLWYYGIWGITVLWLFFEKRSDDKRVRWHLRAVQLLVIVFSIAAALLELPYHSKPNIDATNTKRVIVIGDSLAVGIEDDAVPWPKVLQIQYNLDVGNLSQLDLTLESAIEQAKTVKAEKLDNSVILLQIGWNDVLNRTSIRAFERNLDELLSIVSGPLSTVILLELPFPPFHNQYGSAQRRIAGKYNATLLPKRYVVNVMAQAGAMTDGFLLSPSGHQAMAEMIWGIIRGMRRAKRRE